MTRRSWLVAVVVVALAVLAPALAASVAPPCPTDLDGDGTVGVADLLALLAQWGPCPQPCPPACAGDANDDCAVNVADLLALLGAWGVCSETLDYPPPSAEPEAEQIALELLGPQGDLFAPDELVDRVARDIDLIRQAHPLLATEIDTPAFESLFLVITLDETIPHDELACLNAFYQGEVYDELPVLGFTILRFPRAINTVALAQIYLAAPEVLTANPSPIYGGENFWIPTTFGSTEAAWIWSVDDGFEDCFDGCDCHYFYTFTVTAAGVVTLVDVVTSGPPSCPFKF